MREGIRGLRGTTDVDYFKIVCANCGTETQNEYLGKDPTMPHFKARCPTCGRTFRYKMPNVQWEGLPDKPAPRAGFSPEFENQ